MLYRIPGMGFLRVYIGRSGFITTAFPIPNEHREWMITTDQAGINKDQVEMYTGRYASLRYYHTIALDDGDLNHICKLHKDKLKTLRNIDSKHSISKFLRQTMERNHPATVTSKIGGGINVFYPTNTDKYLKVVVESHGLIVDTYPLSSPDTEWEIDIQQTRINKDSLNSKLNLTAPLRSTGTIYLEEGDSKDGGLNSVYAFCSDLFKHFLRIENKEGVSKFIKTIMEENPPAEVIQAQYGGINVRYSVEKLNILVMISKKGAITQVFMKPYSERDLVTWSTAIDHTAIEMDHIDLFGVPHPWLRYSHIIYTDKHRMTEICKKNFQHYPKMGDKWLSLYIKRALNGHFPVMVNSFKDDPNVIDVVYKYQDDFYRCLNGQYLHVLINSNGCIVNAYTRALQP